MLEKQHSLADQAAKLMPGPAEDLIVHNLIEALEHLREDLDRVELWVAALTQFQAPVPDYEPSDQHTLPPAGEFPRPRP